MGTDAWAKTVYVQRRTANRRCQKRKKNGQLGFDNGRDTTRSQHHSQHVSEMAAPIT